MKALAGIVVAAALGLAGAAGAGGFAPPLATVRTVSAPTGGPSALEWVRYVGPSVGRNVIVPVNGVPVATIEWHNAVQLRIRTKSGVLLSPDEQAAILSGWQDCRHGEARGAMGRMEPNGTYVLDYDCAWLQGS